MKKLMFVLLIVILSSNLFSQSNTIYLTFAPDDKAIGIRYDRQLTDLGFYTSLSYGNYRGMVYDHWKVTGGIVKYISNQINLNFINIFSTGLSYHKYGEEGLEKPKEGYDFPLSFDLGIGARIKRFNLGFCFDFLKWESVLNFGYSF